MSKAQVSNVSQILSEKADKNRHTVMVSGEKNYFMKMLHSVV